jgi:tetratricopeptide (TPR) repeat protein
MFSYCAQDIKTLLKKVDNSKNYKDSIESLNQLSEYYRVVAPDSAMSVSVLAYNISLRERDTFHIIHSGNQLAMVYKEVGKTKLALSTILKNSSFQTGSFSDSLLGTTNLIKGHIYSELSDSPSAIKYYAEAIEKYLLSNDSIGLSYAYSGLGIVHYDLQNLKQALDSYKKSEAYWIDSTGLIADLWNNLGAVYVEFGDWDNAEKYYNKSLALYRQKNWKTDISMVYYNLGELFKIAEEYPKSTDYYYKSLQTAKEIKSGIDVQWALFGLYEVFKESGDINNALLFHERYTDYKDSL